MAIRQHLILSGASLLKLSSFMFWSWLYLWTVASLPDQTPEWYSRVVTLLHGSVAALAGLKQCDFMNITPERLTMHVSAAQYALMAWSWGYFAMDFMWCIVYWSENLVMLCHHLSAIYAVSIYMEKQNSGCTFACTLALMEITNPMLQTRWFIKNAGLGKTKLFLIVEAAYLTSFVIVRGVVGTFVMCKILGSDIFDLEEKIISVIFFLLSWVFMYDIYGYIKHKYEDRIPAVITTKAVSNASEGSASGAEPPKDELEPAPEPQCCRIHDRNDTKFSREVQTLPWKLQPKNLVLIDKSHEPFKAGTAMYMIRGATSLSTLTSDSRTRN